MKIISLELIGYRRIQLNGVNNFSIKMTEIVQLILGTNGSGKSSLLNELSPLPGEPSDFTKDGSKTIRLTNKGNNYLLISKFAPSPKHNFIKNGEEMNGVSGGTISVQKELVKQEFGFTTQIRDLLIGVEKFHEMTPARRREWFTILSPINYDYALEVFTRLKGRANDTVGALKHAKKRLVTENTKLISVNEEEKLRKDVDLIHTELSLLLEHRAPVERPIQEYKNEQTEGLEELTKLSNKLLRLRLVAPYGAHPYGVNTEVQPERDDWYEITQPGFNSIEEIDEYITNIRHNITSKETLINKEVSDYSKIDETVKILIKTGEEGVNALKEKIDAIQDAKESVLSKRKLALKIEEPKYALSVLDLIYETLISAFSNIPENEDKKFSIARLTELRLSLLALKDVSTLRKTQYEKLSVQRTHLETHKANGNTVCPKCHHSWISGFSDAAYDKLIAEITVQENELQKEEKTIQEMSDNINSITEYAEIYRTYSTCVSKWIVLAPFWNYLTDGEYVTRSPRKALSLLEIFRADLELEVTAKQYDDQIAEVVDLIRAAEQVGNVNLADTRLRLEECSLTISGLTNDLTKLKKMLTEYIQYRNQLSEAIELGQKINALMIVVENTTKEMVEMLRRETLNHCIRQLQHSLGVKQEALSSAILQKEIIADLEDQVLKLTTEDEAVKTLLKCLSPTDGLIAEGLMGFIGNFVGQMNALVRKVWTYPLQVKNCGTVGDHGTELDYRFPLMVQSKDNVVPDVKFGSKGMREIIDIAYIVVSMRYLGLAEAPLPMDEPGSALDENHKNAMSLMIKSLMDSQSFTQLFLISHDYHQYGSFPNSETCVLASENITVPEKYNEHILIS